MYILNIYVCTNVAMNICINILAHALFVKHAVSNETIRKSVMLGIERTLITKSVLTMYNVCTYENVYE